MSRLVGSTLDFNNAARIINLLAPASPSEPVRLQDLNSAVEGLAWKDNARVSTASNINIASPGAALDGITMAVNDRVLVRGQTTQTENGIYIWNGAATTLTRSLDGSTFDELESAIVTVDEGTSGGSAFRQTQVNGVIGTNNVIWVSFGATVGAATTASAGIVRLATAAETNAGTDATIAVSPATLATYSGMVRKFSQTFGDGSATQYTITHNLNSQDVTVAVYRTSGAFDEVFCDVEHTTANSITVRFASAVASNQFRAVVHA